MKFSPGIFALTATLAVGIVGCDSSPTETGAPDALSDASGPETSASTAPGRAMAKTRAMAETRPLLNLFDPTQGAGEVVLRRRPGNGTFSWRLETSFFDPGHAYTVWIGNFDDEEIPGTGSNGGWGAGGVVGGNGQVTAAGNHCVWPLNTPLEGGFRPGTPPDCEKIDLDGPIWFFVLDHGEWEPGDMLERWDPTGGTNDPGVLEKILFALF